MIFEIDLNKLSLEELLGFVNFVKKNQIKQLMEWTLVQRGNATTIDFNSGKITQKKVENVKDPKKTRREPAKGVEVSSYKQKRRVYDWDKIKLKLDIIAAKPENRKQTIKAVASVVGIKNPNGLTHQRIKQIWNEMLKKNAKR